MSPMAFLPKRSPHGKRSHLASRPREQRLHLANGWMTLPHMWRHSNSGSRSPTNRWPHHQLLLLPTHTKRKASYLLSSLLLSVPTSWPHDGRDHSWSRGCPTLIRWCMRMVRLGEPSTLTTLSQPNSRPQGSPHPYPHLNLLGQL